MRIEEAKGEGFKANSKSNEKLLLHFFAEFIKASQGEAPNEIVEGNETSMLTSFIE